MMSRQEELGKVTREKNDLLQRVEHLEVGSMFFLKRALYNIYVLMFFKRLSFAFLQKKLQESCNGINRTVDLEEVGPHGVRLNKSTQ